MIEKKFMEYRGKPLVKKDNIIYYGYMNQEVVAMLTIKSYKEVEDVKIPDSIQIQLISTDITIPPQDMVKKHTQKDNLYDALDIAGIWIDRYSK